ncbi:MAG: acetolactate synthase large subunit, partial [Thermoleophilaceae bacterium]|nr:acetolactate synthase large subunit [Thermoleophilaceae bacterium]
MSTVPIETGAAALVAELERAGIELVFGLPGVHNLAVWAALARSDIRLVGVRHEQTAVYAADGLARATGGVGVALTTTGPGAANAVAATGEAWASKSPVVVIATDIATTLRRPSVYRGVLHETRDQAAMFRPVSKQTFVVRSGAEVASVLRAAIATALSPPAGPVYVGIPTDVLTQLAGGVEPVDSPEPEWA